MHFLPPDTVSTVKKGQRVLRLALSFVLLGTFGFWTYQAGAKARQESLFTRKSAEYCAALFGQCDTVALKKVHRDFDSVRLFGPGSDWIAVCRSGKRGVLFHYGEKSSELDGVFYESPRLQAQASANEQASTSDQAAELSLYRMRQFHFFRTGLDYALLKPPVRIWRQRAWRVVWQERENRTGKIHLITTILDAETGLPMMIYRPLRPDQTAEAK